MQCGVRARVRFVHEPLAALLRLAARKRYLLVGRRAENFEVSAKTLPSRAILNLYH